MGAMDELIDKTVVTHLSNLLTQAGLRSSAVVASASEVDGKKLRQRVDVVREALLLDLPHAYPDSATLSRDDPDIAAQIADGWLITPDDNTTKVARHAMRTLVKKGHPQALDVLGFTGTDFVVTGPMISGTVVRLGSSVHFTAQVTSTGTRPARAAVDYLLHFQKARSDVRPKVFKIGVTSLAPGETVDLAVSYSFHPRTTRVFHPGELAIDLQVNGTRFGRATFQLVAAD